MKITFRILFGLFAGLTLLVGMYGDLIGTYSHLRARAYLYCCGPPDRCDKRDRLPIAR